MPIPPTLALRRPRTTTATMAVLGLLGVTALGGAAMLAFPGGPGRLPADLLDGVPLADTFLLPGLVPGLVFGIGSLLALVGMWRRRKVSALSRFEAATGHHWSWALTIVLGVAFAAWMAAQWLWLGIPWAAGDTADQAVAWVLHGAYDAVAVAFLVLPHTRGVRDHLAVLDPVGHGARPHAPLHGPSHVLVTHGATRGTSGGPAERVGQRLRSRGFEVTVLPARQVRDATRFDAVVVGQSLYVMGQPHQFAGRHRTDLAARSVWQFGSSPLDGAPTAQDVDALARVHRALEGLDAGDQVGPSDVVASHRGSGADWHPYRVERWADRVANAMAWEHRDRSTVMTGTAGRHRM